MTKFDKIYESIINESNNEQKIAGYKFTYKEDNNKIIYSNKKLKLDIKFEFDNNTIYYKTNFDKEFKKYKICDLGSIVYEIENIIKKVV